MNEPGDTTPQPTYGEQPSQPSYGAPQPPAPPSWRPYAQGPALPPPAPKRNRRLAFAGSVVAASLLVGGAALVGLSSLRDGVTPFLLPRGCLGAYYPEMNPLVPLDHHDEQSKTPAAKGVPVRIVA